MPRTMAKAWDYASNRDKNCQHFWQTTVGDRSESMAELSSTLATYKGARFETVSTATGVYTLVGLPAGIYNLEASSPGFAKLVQQGIRVQVATIARIDVKLQISSTNESITVVADAPRLAIQNACAPKFGETFVQHEPEPPCVSQCAGAPTSCRLLSITL